MRLRTLATTATLVCAMALGHATAAHADPNPIAIAADNSGLLTGNIVQVPINLPVNLCGNSINVLGLLNPASGTTCQHG